MLCTWIGCLIVFINMKYWNRDTYWCKNFALQVYLSSHTLERRIPPRLLMVPRIPALPMFWHTTPLLSSHFCQVFSTKFRHQQQFRLCRYQSLVPVERSSTNVLPVRQPPSLMGTALLHTDQCLRCSRRWPAVWQPATVQRQVYQRLFHPIMVSRLAGLQMCQSVNQLHNNFVLLIYLTMGQLLSQIKLEPRYRGRQL